MDIKHALSEPADVASSVEGNAAASVSELIPVGEAAALIGISVDTLKRWTTAGRVAAVRTPTNHRRYRRADILELLTPVPTALADTDGGAR